MAMLQSAVSGAIEHQVAEHLYVTNMDKNQLMILDINPKTSGVEGVTGWVATSAMPLSIAISPDGNFVYVGNEHAKLTVLATKKVSICSGDAHFDHGHCV